MTGDEDEDELIPSVADDETSAMTGHARVFGHLAGARVLEIAGAWGNRLWVTEIVHQGIANSDQKCIANLET